MKLFQRGGLWWFDATVNERRIRRTTGIAVTDEKSKRAAWDRAEELVNDAGAPARTTLRQALASTYDAHWSRTRSAQNMQHMVDVLSRQLGHHDVAGLSYGVLKDYGDALIREGYAPATVNRRLTAVGVALREQARRGNLRQRPELPHYAENNKRERYVSLEEEHAVLEWFQRQQAAAVALRDHELAGDWSYMHALVVFLLDTGFRFSEAFKFDVSGGMACLKLGETKNNKGRNVPLTERACRAADVMLAFGRHRQFASILAAEPESKKPWDWCDHRWKRAARASGCADVTLHMLRHTCASRLLQRGVSIYLVSKWLGHSSVKVTERYAHHAPDSLSQALAALQGGPVAVAEPLPGTGSSRNGSDSTGLRHKEVG